MYEINQSINQTINSAVSDDYAYILTLGNPFKVHEDFSSLQPCSHLNVLINFPLDRVDPHKVFL